MSSWPFLFAAALGMWLLPKGPAMQPLLIVVADTGQIGHSTIVLSATGSPSADHGSVGM
jgi:hypothetical protein